MGDDFDMYASLSMVWNTSSWTELCDEDNGDSINERTDPNGSWTELLGENVKGDAERNAEWADLGMSFLELPVRPIAINETGDDFSMDEKEGGVM